MAKTFEDYLDDPRIKDEPMGLRVTHAMRFKIQDETEGMTAAEHTAYFYGCVKKQEDGNFLLRPRELVNKIAPQGLTVTHVTLSHMGFTIPWFVEFLAGKESGPTEYPADGKAYRVFRDSGNAFLEEKRDGGFVNIVGFSSVEIPKVLIVLRYYMRVNSDSMEERESAAQNQKTPAFVQ